MSSTTERIFVIGGTGNVGSKCVEYLLGKQLPVTLLARTPDKVATLYPGANKDSLKVVQGEYDNYALLETVLPGHSRLFLLIGEFEQMDIIKGTIARLAYAAGIRQILDVSSISVNDPWRSTHIGYKGFLSEQAILRASEQVTGTSYVTLRPTRFMSNILTFDRPGPDSCITDHASSNTHQSWISPTDIGHLAAVVLSEPIEKHGNAVYTMVGQVVTPAERADIMTRVLGRSITYKQVTSLEQCNGLMALVPILSFPAAYHLSTLTETWPVSIGLPLLLGREPESLEAFLEANKQKLL